MKNKGFMTSVQLHIPSSVEFSFSFCWCRQIPGFRWERQAVRDESKCHFCRDQCENQTHCWCFGLFHVLYCLLLPSSHSSASRKLKKKKKCWQTAREGVECLFSVDPRRRDKNPQPPAAPRPLLNAVSPTLCHHESEGTVRAGDPRAKNRPSRALRRHLLSSNFISHSLFSPALLNCFYFS